MASGKRSRGWFESCIARGVLDAALQEVGFDKLKSGEESDAPNVVNVAYDEPESPESVSPERLNFKVGGYRGMDYIVGELPAYIAARQLGEASRAAS